jgi:Fe-S cluster assembly scaffold protein SufB
MDADVRVGAGATMKYTESHYHGQSGGIEVQPKTRVSLAEGGRFITTFNLTHGRVGRLDIEYEVGVAARGLAELTTKVYGYGDDDVRVRETVHLDGAEARGLTKTRVAVREWARSHIHTITEGNAPGSVGHMDCTEIVRDQAQAENIPVVVVRNDQARVTHEAAIGTVNKKELETLMARGLDEDQAVDVIIRGMLQ